MGIKNLAKKDFRTHITSTSGVGSDIVFKQPESDGLEVTIRGIAMNHNFKFDEAGQPISSEFSWVTIAEQDLVDAGYPTRNADGKVSLSRHKVTFQFANGTSITQIVSTVDPDNVMGLIRMELARGK